MVEVVMATVVLGEDGKQQAVLVLGMIQHLVVVVDGKTLLSSIHMVLHLNHHHMDQTVLQNQHLVPHPMVRLHQSRHSATVTEVHHLLVM